MSEFFAGARKKRRATDVKRPCQHQVIPLLLVVAAAAIELPQYGPAAYHLVLHE